MKKTLLGLLAVGLCVLSCKKDDPDPVAPVAQPYMNSNTGSNWIYEEKTDPGTWPGETSLLDTVTVTDRDTTVEAGTPNERVYNVLSHSTGTSTYEARTGSDYYQFQNLAALGGASVQALYLKDNAAVGATWTQDVNVTVPGVPIPITLTLNNSIEQKGFTKVVSGITYNDVIEVKTLITSAALPAGSITSDIRNFYARNIGLIEGKYDIDVPVATLAIHTLTTLKFSDPR